jgi:phage-related protein
MHWYDPETDPSQFMAALWKVRHLCTRLEHVRMTVPGSHVLVQAIMSAIDDYAERETGNREYFWNKPYGRADVLGGCGLDGLTTRPSGV